MDKLFWHIIPCGTVRAPFTWGGKLQSFYVPLSKVGEKNLQGNQYLLYEGEILGQPCQASYIFGEQGLLRVRVEFKWDTSHLKNRHQLVEKVFNGLCDLCGTPGSNVLEQGRFYEQGLVTWNIEDTSLVLAISTYKVVLNAFARIMEEPEELDSELSRLIDELAQVLRLNQD